MLKSHRRELKRNKRHAHRVHAGFSPQYNAMAKREIERRQNGRDVRAMKENV